MTKPPTQRVSVAGMDTSGMMESTPEPVSSDLARARNRMRARLAAMPATTLQRTGQATLVIDGQVTIAQLEALLFLMTDQEGWMP